MSTQVFFTPLSQALRLMIHLGEPLPEARLNEFHFDFSVLGLFFLLPYVLMMWTNGVGASTGMFVPALAVGATGMFPEQCSGLQPATLRSFKAVGRVSPSGSGPSGLSKMLRKNPVSLTRIRTFVARFWVP